jgi:Holliday junction DNA helicase RuvB
MISILNTLQEGDILFIDEIHRLRPVIEEMLYIAMEDFALDMVMPDGGNVRIPVNSFTLIGATTKLESLSDPFKNRFVYKFHFTDYTTVEKHHIIQRYLDIYHIKTSSEIIELIERKVESIPREIHNFCIKMRDFLVAYEHHDMTLTPTVWASFEQRVQVHDG